MPPRTRQQKAARAPDWGEELLRAIPDTLERRGVVARPFPPGTCDEESPVAFAPDPRFAEWIRDTFLLGSGPLQNEEHAHLMDAHLGVLWTNAINKRQQRLVLATAEIPFAMAGGWKRARFEFQMTQWFGTMPDFVLTFSAPDCLRLDDRQFCALVEHELYHCAQALDKYGEPRFNNDTGAPVYAIKGHDVEEFTGVVRRYGATSREVRELVAAASSVPLIGGAPISHACGTVGAAA